MTTHELARRLLEMPDMPVVHTPEMLKLVEVPGASLRVVPEWAEQWANHEKFILYVTEDD